MAYLVAGAILGGFVNGLTGFGFALMASGLWLQVLLPAQMVPLLVASMLVANLQALPRVWRMIEPRRSLPLVLGGVFGVPLGVWMLSRIPRFCSSRGGGADPAQSGICHRFARPAAPAATV